MNQQAAQSLPSQTSNSYFARHWRGELSLPKSYWLNGVLLFGFGCNFVFATIAIIVASLMPTPVGVLIILVDLALDLVGYTWALVGTWRSAIKYQGPRVWSILARVAISIGVLITLGRLGQDLSFIGHLANRSNM